MRGKRGSGIKRGRDGSGGKN